MLTALFNNLQGVAAAVELGIIAVGGVLVFTGAIGGKAREIKDESDAVAQRLIENYKLTVDNQDKKIRELTDREIVSGKAIAHLEGQVKTLTEILQGKDPKMQSFLNNAPGLLDLAKETSEATKQQAVSLAALTSAIEKLINNLPPMTPTILP